MQIIAESVELKKNVEFLLSKGCYVSQGYYGRPIKQADYTQYYEDDLNQLVYS